MTIIHLLLRACSFCGLKQTRDTQMHDGNCPVFDLWWALERIDVAQKAEG